MFYEALAVCMKFFLLFVILFFQGTFKNMTVGEYVFSCLHF